MKFKEALTYDDVLLVPQYSDIKSRAEIDIGNYLDDHLYLELPIISSPMDTVTESKMSIAMHDTGGLPEIILNALLICLMPGSMLFVLMLHMAIIF